MRAARFIAGYDTSTVPVPERWSKPSAVCATASSIVSDRAGPRRASTSWPSVERPEPKVCGSSWTPASPRSSCPSCRPCALEQDPIHRHKDVLAHTIAVAKTVATVDGAI